MEIDERIMVRGGTLGGDVSRNSAGNHEIVPQGEKRPRENPSLVPSLRMLFEVSFSWNTPSMMY